MITLNWVNEVKQAADTQFIVSYNRTWYLEWSTDCRCPSKINLTMEHMRTWQFTTQIRYSTNFYLA